ncbi:MAG TPA: hypothetical protein VJU61_10145 [Polyangiaceae bacterium]|nr:hypothetical protein [Polyangiaceae bacterium]
MTSAQLRLLILVIAISLISGVGDAQGFIHASRMWQGGKLVAHELVRSALGFATGIGSYWLAIKYLQEYGILAPEAQTLIWFGVTILGVAVLSGRFLRWPATDQAVGVIVLAGLSWLLIRTGEG